jgi:hypothetical protein
MVDQLVRRGEEGNGGGVKGWSCGEVGRGRDQLASVFD